MKLIEINKIINELEEETLNIMEESEIKKIEIKKLKDILVLYNRELIRRITYKELINLLDE